MRGDKLKGHLDLLLLAAIRRGCGHGYAIAEEIRRRSGRAIHLPEGTIYPALHRLEAASLVRSRWTRGGARRRRVYALTAKGKAALSREREEWTAFTEAVAGVVGART